MEIKQLRHFLAVSELGSFSKAAVVLSVAQPVLSRQIRALEDELGIELLYRNGRGIVLTDAGRLLCDHARQIINAAELASSELTALRAAPSGTVVIGVPPTVGTVLTVPLVMRYRRDYPNVALRVIEGYSGHVLEWLSTGRIDVAVLYNAPRTSTLQTEPLIEEELFLIGPPGEEADLVAPVDGRTLETLPLILPSPRHGLRALVDSLLKEAGCKPNVVFEIDALTPELSLVEEGVGYAILPYASVHRQVRAGWLTCRPIVDPRMKRQMVLATSTQRPTTVLTRDLAKMVRVLVRDLVADGVWMPRAEPAPAGGPCAAATTAPRTARLPH